MVNSKGVSDTPIFMLTDILKSSDARDHRVLINDQLTETEVANIRTFAGDVVTDQTPATETAQSRADALKLYRSSFELPYNDNEFDLVHMKFADVFPYFRLLHYCHQINRVLKNGGFFIFSIQEHDGLVNPVNEKLDNISKERVNEIDLKRLLLPYFAIRSMERVRKVLNGVEYFQWEVSAMKNVLL